MKPSFATRVGILGGGQLGRMLCLAGLPLNLKFHVWEKESPCPASAVAQTFSGSLDDKEALNRFADAVDVITYESENFNVTALETLHRTKPVVPSISALAQGQDRLQEKELFTRLKIRTTNFRPVQSYTELEAAVKEIGYPAVLKTRRFGYDGKGQAVVRRPQDLRVAWESLASAKLILEEFVAFDREVSLLGVRDRNGEIAFYPLVENHHESGILHWSLTPAPKAKSLETEARASLRRLLLELDYCGVLVVEFFVVGGKLFANEMAPRVHNSGHWTIEGAETSQFENHLRAITGLPLGSTALRAPSLMVNLIGTLPDTEKILKNEGTHLHLYGKAPRPGRKLGHVTLCGEDLESRFRRLKLKPLV